MADKVSKEEMEKEMILNTKKGIYELGIQHALIKIEEEKTENRIQKYRNKIFKNASIPEEDYIKTLDNYTYDDWILLFHHFNIYYSEDKKNLLYIYYFLLNNIEKENNKNLKEIRLLKENIEDLNDESNNTIEELDEYEKKNKNLISNNEWMNTKYNISKYIIIIMSIIIFIQNITIFKYLFIEIFKIIISNILFVYLCIFGIIYYIFNITNIYNKLYFQYNKLYLKYNKNKNKNKL